MIRPPKEGLYQLGNVILLLVICFPDSIVCNERNITWKYERGTLSSFGQYEKAAVSSTTEECSRIGTYILAKNGSAVDAAISTILCEGTASFQGLGLGGGMQMTIWNAETKTAHSLVAREKASRHAKADMYDGVNKSSYSGGLAVAVPGELLGLWEAHKKFGKLDWNELFQPVIDICENGFHVNHFLHVAINMKESKLRGEPTLSKITINPVTNETYKEGDKITRPIFAETLKKLSASDGSGVEDFYNGTMAKTLVADIQAHNGIIDEEDFRRYRVQWKESINKKLGNLTLYTSPPPGSGALLSLILNVLNGFVFEKGEKIGYQRMAETFKWAYASRTKLGDPDFEPEVLDLIKNITSKEYAEKIRSSIKDDWTSQDPKYYGAETMAPDDHGTLHISILAPDGSAVSVTSTINGRFGAFFRSESTGVIFNNNMDDFASPNITNSYGLPPSPTNVIKPEKRPQSSATPTILVDENNDVQLVIGGIGGPRITTSVAFTMVLHLWAGYNIKEAVEAHRIHHQLLPMQIWIEKGLAAPIEDYLTSVGHDKTYREGYINLVMAISKQNGLISTYSDQRRFGKVDGF